MQHPAHTPSATQPELRRLIVVVLILSGLTLPPALWFGPVSLTYLLASVVLGVIFAILLVLAQRYQPSRWGGVLQGTGVATIIIGSLLARSTLLSPYWQRVAVWSTFVQGIGVLLLSTLVILALRQRVLPQWGTLRILCLLLVIGALVWYRADQSRPLVYPAARQVIVDDDAPPGVRVVQFTTTAPPATVLRFYQQQLDARGWTYTCSTDRPPCESNLSDGSDGLRAVYHRQLDRTQRGPTYEILLRQAADDGTLVTVYDQSRGIPMPPHWP